MTNPFAADDDDDNPFAGGDPSPPPSLSPSPFVSAPSPPPPDPSTPFNPFRDEADPPPPSSSLSSIPSSSTPLRPSSTRSSTGGYRDNTGGFHSFADMDRREEELRRREAELANYEEQVRNKTYQRPTEKNFPPYLHWWSWHPQRDLPENVLGLMTKLRILFMSLFLIYLVNFAGCLGIFVMPKETSDGEKVEFSGSVAVRMALSAIFDFVLVPLSFELAFFPIYKGITRARAIGFFCGLAVYVIWTLFVIFTLIGIPDCGSLGYIMMFEGFQENTGIGVIALVFCITGTLAAVALAFGLIALVRYYRANGLVEKAKMEAGNMAVDYAKEHPDQAVEMAKALS